MKKLTTLVITILLISLLAACTLPIVTPPVETTAPTELFTVPDTNEVISTTEVPTAVAVEINSKNAQYLAPIYISPINNVQQIIWANDGSSLLLVTQNLDSDGTQLFGITTLTAPGLEPTGVFSTKDGRISDISNDGKIAALISTDLTTCSLIDLSAGNTVTQSIVPGFLIANVTFSPDSKYIAITKTDTLEVELFNFSTGEEVRLLSGFETAAPVFTAGFNTSPQWMVWISRASLQLQECETGKMGARFDHEDFIVSYALTDDGTILATGSGKMVDDNFAPVVKMWDAVDGIELYTITLPEMANSLAFSPTGKLLALGAGTSLIVVDSTNGNLVTTLTSHNDQINTVIFSPDGKYIATSGLDNQLIIWAVLQ